MDITPMTLTNPNNLLFLCGSTPLPPSTVCTQESYHKISLFWFPVVLLYLSFC